MPDRTTSVPPINADPSTIDWRNPPIDYSEGWVNIPVYPPDMAIIGLPGAGKTTTLEEIIRHELGLPSAPGVDLDIDLPKRTLSHEGDEPADRIANVTVSTFRKVMAEEVGDRVARLIGEELPKRHWIRTTHSICYQLLDINTEQVVTEADRLDFCKEFGVAYQKPPRAANGTDQEVPGWFNYGAAGNGNASAVDAVGNQLFDMRSFAINTFRDPTEEWRHLGLDIGQLVELNGPSCNRIERFNRDYEAWKDEHDKIDYDDMLRIVYDRGICPPGQILIEDEYQDKTPLQVAIYNIWAENASYVVVAGDPFQSIYSYSGCDPRYMRKAEYSADQREVLETSYRYGPSLWNFATPILEDVGYDVPEIEPVGESDVYEIGLEDYQELAREHSDETVLHLARTNYLCKKLADALDDAGVPYNDGGYTTNWTPRMILLYDAAVALYTIVGRERSQFGHADYSGITVGQAQTIVPALPSQMLTDDVMKKTVLNELERLEPGRDDHRERLETLMREWFPIQNLTHLVDKPTPFDAMLKSHVARSQPAFDRLRTAWKTRGAKSIGMIAPEEVGTTKGDLDMRYNVRLPHSIETIHGAKGQEADVVFLLDATTDRVRKQGDPHEEARVWFVGSTRAKQTLYLVQSGAKCTYDFPVHARKHITNGTPTVARDDGADTDTAPTAEQTSD